MAHSNQAKKRVRQNEVRRVHNKAIKSSMRSAVKITLQAVEAGDAAKAQSALALAMRRLDKAAKTNTIHQNAANRQKSRLAAKVASLA
jgi:small subunit ribosomal protein S20